MASKAQTRTETPLFYGSPVPLDRERHRGLRTGHLGRTFEFARGAHFVPALIDEFSPASREIPILFIPGPKHPSPVFMLGLRSGRNSLLAADGTMTTRYVPAYLRRYPFILGEAKGKDSVVCIDERNTVLSEDEGEPLFDENGQATPVLERAIRLTSDYFEAGKRTEAFVALLHELDLFHAITIETRSGSDGQTVHGLLAVNEARLYEISDEEFLNLRNQRLLAPIFAHFFSLSQIDRLREAASA